MGAASLNIGCELEGELDSLRRELLSRFAFFSAVSLLTWYAYVALRDTGWRAHDFAPLVLAAELLIVYFVRKFYVLRCWLFLVGTLFCIRLLTHGATGIAVVADAFVIIGAGVLLGKGAPCIVSLLALGMNFFLGGYVGGTVQHSELFRVGVFYALLCAVIRVVVFPLQETIEQILEGWMKSLEALGEARQRRGELYRVVRALEEATYRVERVNNELLVARKEAEEARALKARFVATVSHEIRGPLHLILGFAKMMALSPESYGAPLPRAYRADISLLYRTMNQLPPLVIAHLFFTQT
ncbi:MAG: hypothetical protein J7M05_01995, partial [Anaerolineae bacterium]|nr:hypothetical protein [Anaerolineae bacterium]